MPVPDKVDAIRRVCDHLAAGDHGAARRLIRDEYPFEPVSKTGRRYGRTEMTRVFVSDGFIDRYSGCRLVFPPVLVLLSRAMPQEFPHHPNWKMDSCHIGYWMLTAQIDHIVPLSRGGADEPANWATTSGMRNTAKAQWTLDELGWSLHPRGRFEDWDGLLGWFLGQATAGAARSDKYIQSWRRAAQAVLAERGGS